MGVTRFACLPDRGDRWLRAVALLLTFVALASGCDGRPARVPVAGKVLIDGRPLTQGSLQVCPDNGRPATAVIQPDGSFQLTTFDDNDGALLGEHPVTILAIEHLSPTRMRWLAPKKYAKLDSTDLRVTIDKPTDNLVIQLSWDGKGPFVEIDPADASAPPSAAKATSAEQN